MANGVCDDIDKANVSEDVKAAAREIGGTAEGSRVVGGTTVFHHRQQPEGIVGYQRPNGIGGCLDLGTSKR